jgi:hypothetical protein
LKKKKKIPQRFLRMRSVYQHVIWRVGVCCTGVADPGGGRVTLNRAVCAELIAMAKLIVLACSALLVLHCALVQGADHCVLDGFDLTDLERYDHDTIFFVAIS